MSKRQAIENLIEAAEAIVSSFAPEDEMPDAIADLAAALAAIEKSKR